MEEKALTNNVVMIRPHNFGFNEQTAPTNKFQRKANGAVNSKALSEFNNAVKKLIKNGINVFVFDDLVDLDTPDSVFPNNWVSFHSDGTVVLYPMLARNRRAERRTDLLYTLSELYGFNVSRLLNLTDYEHKGKFLEGTGSLVLDRGNHIAYSCLSERTDSEVVDRFCRFMGYTAVKFKAYDKDGFTIYHTNVIMNVCSDFVMVCLNSIRDEEERNRVIDSIESSGKRIIDLSQDQIQNFAGNALELLDRNGRRKLVISKKAFDSLSTGQKALIRKYDEMLTVNVDTIEECGGGSIRCMLAEVFLPIKKAAKGKVTYKSKR
ncbi:MAG: arginine deiminase-related protein [Candidatus Parvarchaeota archaeon]|jgi:Uncharacterized protein conserved in bacteria containing a pentein-type domain|nr:arginine deiminase-related protein [Candidatus Parvarchaeota archaeon]